MDKFVNQPTDGYILFCIKSECSLQLGTGIFVHKGVISSVNKVEFILDKV
jgi:hypothetical protein